MRRLPSRFAVFLLAAALLTPPGALAQEPLASPSPPLASSYAPLIDKAAPAVVNIYARKLVRSRAATQRLDGSAFWRLFRDTLLFGYGQDRIENSLGSGVIVDASGVIVTNHHVVAEAEGIVAALADGRAYSAAILLSDRRTDLAVLRVRAEAPLPFLAFGDSDALRVGDPLIVIGNPFGLGQTVTTGIVSALARTTAGAGDFRFFIQTDAAVNPGNSGGAQIALDGKLVGISTAIYSTNGGSHGIGFAIPASMAKRIVESAVSGRPPVFAWIGLSGQGVPPQFARLLGLSGSHGVLVAGVYRGGPAERAGLAAGDVVLAVNGIPVNDPMALSYRVASAAPGASLRLIVMRGGLRYEVPVMAIAPPAEPPREETAVGGLSPLRGARIASLSPAFAQEIGADSGITGVAVLDVGQGSAAAKIGLEAGDIVRNLDGREVATVADILTFQPLPYTPWRMIVTRAGAAIAIRRPAEMGFSPKSE